jgi:predicted ATPase
VGRAGELTVLAGELAAATAASEVRTVLVVGEAGVGKSRIVEEFTGGLDRSVTVLSARAAPLGNSDPMGLWAQAVDGHFRGLTDEEVIRLCGGMVDDLGALSRRAAAVTGRLFEAPRHRLFEGVATVLARLAGRGPVVVALDDVHLADASSWETLHHVAQGLANSAVLILATARPEELASNSSGRSIAFALEQDRRLRRVPVGPLDGEAMCSLIAGAIGAAPPSELVDWVTQRSRGNVLFTLGLIHALVEEGADLAHPALRHLPESLTGRVAERVAGLADRPRAVVETLAVLGRPAEAGTLAALLGTDRLTLDAILAELERTGLVAEPPGSRTVMAEIAHPLVGEAVYAAIAPAARRVQHRTIARHLLTQGRTGEAAIHFARSCGGHADNETTAALCGALREADERQADQEAVQILEVLSELLPSGDPAWAEVATAMQWAPDWVIDHRADNAAAGIAAVHRIAAVLATSPDGRLRASVQLRLASFLGWGEGRGEEAEAECRGAIALFEKPTIAQVCFSLATSWPGHNACSDART